MAVTIWPVGLRLLFDVLCGLAPADAAARTVYVGFASEFPVDTVATLENVTEITTAGYTREAVSWAGNDLAEPVQNWNETDLTFGPMEADMTVPANYAFLCTAASGTTGDLLISWDLENTPGPIQVSLGEPILVPATQLIVE